MQGDGRFTTSSLLRGINQLISLSFSCLVCQFLGCLFLLNTAVGLEVLRIIFRTIFHFDFFYKLPVSIEHFMYVRMTEQWMFQHASYDILPIPVAARSIGVGLRSLACWDCGFESRWLAWIFVCCECCVLSGRDFYDELITRPEESYRLQCVVVCDLETS